MRWSLFVLLCACGPKPAAQELRPTFEPDEDTSTAIPVPSGQHYEATGPLKRGVPDALKGVRVHVADSTLLLFADEQAEASRMIASALRDTGVVVEDPKRTREIYDRAARGLDVKTGKACGANLDRTSAAKRWGAEIGTAARIETAVYCEERCWIEVNIEDGIDRVLPPHPKRTAHYAAPYDIGQPWRTELPRRLGELVAFRSLRDYGRAKYVAGAVDPAPKPDLSYGDTNEQLELPASFAPAMKQCIGTRGAVSVLVETDANDKVARCEPYPRALDNTSDLVPCVCNALAGKSLDGKGPRRTRAFTRGVAPALKTDGGLLLNVQDQERDEASGRFEVKVSHPSLASWETPSWIDLEACFTPMSEGLITADVEVTFDQVGKATRVEMTPTAGTMTPAMETCVRAAYLTSKGSCPAVPTSVGYAQLFASATKQ
ncbi:MAG: hypothetical protein ACKV2T_04115 [Kofleriaceae bacterium]